MFFLTPKKSKKKKRMRLGRETITIAAVFVIVYYILNPKHADKLRYFEHILLYYFTVLVIEV